MDLMKKKKSKKIVVTLDINEGWDARAYDKVNHYFVRNRAICNVLIRYHPPYFSAGWIPEEDDPERYDYCNGCVQLLINRRNHVDLERFFQR